MPVWRLEAHKNAEFYENAISIRKDKKLTFFSPLTLIGFSLQFCRGTIVVGNSYYVVDVVAPRKMVL